MNNKYIAKVNLMAFVKLLLMELVVSVDSLKEAFVLRVCTSSNLTTINKTFLVKLRNQILAKKEFLVYFKGSTDFCPSPTSLAVRDAFCFSFCN